MRTSKNPAWCPRHRRQNRAHRHPSATPPVPLPSCAAGWEIAPGMRLQQDRTDPVLQSVPQTAGALLQACVSHRVGTPARQKNPTICTPRGPHFHGVTDQNNSSYSLAWTEPTILARTEPSSLAQTEANSLTQTEPSSLTRTEPTSHQAHQSHLGRWTRAGMVREQTDRRTDGQNPPVARSPSGALTKDKGRDGQRTDG
jgi:hypothetical protein